MKRQLYARISGSISEYCQWQSLRMLPSLSLLDLRAAFPYFVGKLKKQLDRWNILKISFDSGKALSYVEYGKKILPVAESYLIDDAGRKEERGTGANGT